MRTHPQATSGNDTGKPGTETKRRSVAVTSMDCRGIRFSGHAIRRMFDRHISPADVRPSSMTVKL